MLGLIVMDLNLIYLDIFSYLQALNSMIVAVSITRVIVGGCQLYFVRQKVFPWNLAHQRGSVKILDKAPMPTT